jgi:hypothetical protein
MAGLRRVWFLAFLAGVLLAPGCDLGSLLYFVMPDARENAKIKQLACEDGKKDPHVAILTYNTALETRSELIQADRQLTDLLAKRLLELAKENKEKLTIISPRKVEEYKNTHPDWNGQDLHTVGKALAADYLVYLEINKLSLYQPNSRGQFFRGQAEMSITLHDMKHPDENTTPRHFSRSYPSDAQGGAVSVFESDPVAFRERFMNYLVRELALHFSHYPKSSSETMGVEFR